MSRIILGTMTWGRETDYREAAKCYDLARTRGIDTFDTAAIYGEGKAEKWLGTFAKGDAGVKINTKVGYNGGDIYAEAHRSSERLQRKPYTIFHHHWMKHGCKDAEMMLAQIEEDLAAHIGLSNCAAWQAVAVEKRVPLDAVQFLYNLLKRQAEVEIIPACQHFGWEMQGYSPLASGLLTGKYDHASDPSWRLFSDDRYRRRYMNRPSTSLGAVARLQVGHNALWRFSGVLKCSPARLALAWAEAGGARPIVGARDAGQLQSLLGPPDSSGYTEGSLLDKYVEELSEIYPAPPPATDRSEEHGNP